VDAVRASGGRVAVRRDKDGTLNWAALLTPTATVAKAPAASAPVVAAPASTAAATTAPATSASAWPDVRVGEVALQDFQIGVTDLAAPRPAKLALSALQFSLRDVSFAEGAEMPLRLSFDWAPQGKVAVEGKVGLRPAWRAELQSDVTDFALLPLSPYLEQELNARIAQGAVTFRQTVRLEPGAGETAVTAAGDLRVDRLGLVDGALEEELAGFTSLTLSGIEIATAPTLTASLREVALVEPYARVVVREDKSLNLAGLVRSATPSTPPSVAPVAATAGNAAARPAPRIAIGAIKIEAGDFSFVDRSLNPAVRVALASSAARSAGCRRKTWRAATSPCAARSMAWDRWRSRVSSTRSARRASST
jgi:hypothetical protein